MEPTMVNLKAEVRKFDQWLNDASTAKPEFLVFDGTQLYDDSEVEFVRLGGDVLVVIVELTNGNVIYKGGGLFDFSLNGDCLQVGTKTFENIKTGDDE